MQWISRDVFLFTTFETLCSATRGVASKTFADVPTGTARPRLPQTRALELNPEFVEALVTRGNAWKSKGDNNEAIEDYTRALLLDPQNVGIMNNRGTARLAKFAGEIFRPLYNGKLQGYASTMAGGIALILAWIVWVWMRGGAS